MTELYLAPEDPIDPIPIGEDQGDPDNDDNEKDLKGKGGG